MKVRLSFGSLPLLCEALVTTPVIMPLQRSSRRLVATTPDTSSQTTPSRPKRALGDAGLTHRAVVSPGDDSLILTSELVGRVKPSQLFQDLKVAPSELRPSATLTTGQCFHWKAISASNEGEEGNALTVKTSAWGSHNATEWIGTLRMPCGNSMIVVIRETPETTLFRVLSGPDHDKATAFLSSYFQLDIPLVPLYQEWSRQCSRLEKIAMCIPGVRIVDQDPWECLCSFICSANNNIPRITKMLASLRREYGEPLLTIGEETFYSFPSLETLQVRANEDDLRKKCGLGYRARYIIETMNILGRLGGEAYLQELRHMSNPVDVQSKLIQFAGVGRKVADCVALFSLKQDDAIPVDVHVWNIARRDYDVESTLEKMNSLTPANYNLVGDLFRSRFISKCGWAHSLLFVAELPSFRPALPVSMVSDMDDFKKEEKARKARGREFKKRQKTNKELT